MDSSDKDERRGVRWDEDNLEENERIKKELNPRKIDEPKTPYLSMSPMDTDDEQHDTWQRQNAEQLFEQAAAAGEALENSTRHSAWSDSSDGQNNNTSHSPSKAAAGRNHSPRFSEEYYANDSDNENSDDPEVVEKKRKFKEARKKHYHMEFMSQTKVQRELDNGVEEDEEQQQQQQQQQDGNNNEGGDFLDVDINGEEMESNGGYLPERTSSGVRMALPSKSVL